MTRKVNTNQLAPSGKVGLHRGKSTSKEEKSQETVHLAWREQHIRPNHSPNDASSVEHSCRRACEVVWLVNLAHIRDVLKHPGLHAKLDQTRDDSCDDLTPEHRSWSVRISRVSAVRRRRSGHIRDLHVMSEFHVRGERDS